MKEADENGWVPLHLAALNKLNSNQLIEVLLKQDRNTAYMRDNKGRTALHFAAYCGNYLVMRKIIEYCPDCSELVDHKGRNALHYSTSFKGGKLPVIERMAVNMTVKQQELINMQNEKDNDGNTPLHLLAHYAPTWKNYNNHPLLKGGPKVDRMAFNKNNQTALDVAFDIVPSTSKRENFSLRQLQRKIRARFGGRVINENDQWKKQHKRHASATIEKQKQENKEKEEDDDLTTQDRVRQTLLMVATLIATVTFTAGFTMPWGTIQDGKNKGSPILLHNASFQVFVVTDTLSFISSAFAVFVQIFSSFVEGKKNFFISDRISLLTALFLTMLGMVFMIAAFEAATFAVFAPSEGLICVALCVATAILFNCILYLVYRQEESSIWFPEMPKFSVDAAEDMQLLDSV